MSCSSNINVCICIRVYMCVCGCANVCACICVSADEDFSSQPITLTVRPDAQLSREDNFAIPLLDDDAFEAEEVFLIRLDANASDPADRATLSVRHWTKVFIRPGSDSKKGTVFHRSKYSA